MVLVEKMVMLASVCVEIDLPSPNHQLSEEARLGKSVQGVVNRRKGNSFAPFRNRGINGLGRHMLVRPAKKPVR